MENCRECNAQLLVNPEICSEFAGLCVNCYSKACKQDHIARCRKCQSFLDKGLKKNCDFCSGYFPQSALYQVPNCRKHKFCLDCLSRSLTAQEFSKFCTYCRGLFERNSERYNKDKCNLCMKPHYLSLNGYCDEHRYCNQCLNFIQYNDSIHFPGIKSCRKCRTFCEQAAHFKSVKNEVKWKTDTLDTARKVEERKLICQNNHEYRDLNALDEKLNTISMKKCASCIKMFLKLEILTKCIFCYRINDINIKDRCSEYRNICTTCFFPQIEISHVRTCVKCKVNLLGKIQECDCCTILYETAELYRLPKCKNHMFCKNCLHDPEGKVNTYHCGECLTYFFNIGRSLGDDLCNLCGTRSVIFPQECRAHGYCDPCYEFIMREDCSEFPNISSCEDCRNHIKSMKMKGKCIECDKHHSHEKEELLNNIVTISSTTNCGSCKKLFLSLIGLNICIFCQNALQGDPASRCSDYRNICESCYILHADPAHLGSCFTCKRTYRDYCKRCEFCHHYVLESGLFKVPRCKDHRFCAECLSKPAPLSCTLREVHQLLR